jgi:hypothetical protein
MTAEEISARRNINRRDVETLRDLVWSGVSAYGAIVDQSACGAKSSHHRLGNRMRRRVLAPLRALASLRFNQPYR